MIALLSPLFSLLRVSIPLFLVLPALLTSATLAYKMTRNHYEAKAAKELKATIAAMAERVKANEEIAANAARRAFLANKRAHEETSALQDKLNRLQAKGDRLCLTPDIVDIINGDSSTPAPSPAPPTSSSPSPSSP